VSSIVLGRDTATVPKWNWSARTLKRLALLVLAIALGGAAAWSGYRWWLEWRFIESTDDAYVGGNVTTISPHVAGFVATILVADNEHVQAGQLLARLDRRDFQAAYDRAQAVVEGREAILAQLRAQYVLQKSVISQAAADLIAKTARAAFSHEDAQRYAALAQTSVGSSQDAHKTKAADQEAAAAVLSSQANQDAARQQLSILDTRIAEARAAIAQAEADLQVARLNLDYTDIRSPIEGYIGNRAAQVGLFVPEGAYLLSVIPAHGLWVDANFKEDQLARMRAGQSATTIADVVSGHVFHGRVLSFAPGTGAVFSVIPPENATGNFTKIVQRVPVRIELDAGDEALGILRPGLSTTVSVDTRRSP
jgi:membrane fusion protein, multidrug efflux system